MVHGMGGGTGLWAQNVDSLAEKRPVYMFDLLGFGRSSRPRFGSSAKLVEMEFIESIEEWRQEMKIEKMALLGHSLGAYLVSAYALKYPDKIQHLFLIDPWGFPDKPADNERSKRIPTWARAVAKVLSPFNPLAVVRAAGPWGNIPFHLSLPLQIFCLDLVCNLRTPIIAFFLSDKIFVHLLLTYIHCLLKLWLY